MEVIFGFLLFLSLSSTTHSCGTSSSSAAFFFLSSSEFRWWSKLIWARCCQVCALEDDKSGEREKKKKSERTKLPIMRWPCDVRLAWRKEKNMQKQSSCAKNFPWKTFKIRIGKIDRRWLEGRKAKAFLTLGAQTPQKAARVAFFETEQLRRNSENVNLPTTFVRYVVLCVGSGIQFKSLIAQLAGR